jgi:hypothetical protein
MNSNTLGMIVLALLAGGAVVAAFVSLKEEKMHSAQTMEIVIYKTKPGITPEAHRRHAVAAGAVLAMLDGFQGRSFSEGEKGEWVDVVYWRDLAAAEQAMKTASELNRQEIHDFFEDIDGASIQMRHTTIRARH